MATTQTQSGRLVGYARASDEVVRAVKRSGWLEVHGVPGVGKSSLVRSALPGAIIYDESELSARDIALFPAKKKKNRRPLVVIDSCDSSLRNLRALERWQRSAEACVVVVSRRPFLASLGLAPRSICLRGLGIPKRGSLSELSHPAVRMLATMSNMEPLREHVELAILADGIPLVLRRFATLLSGGGGYSTSEKAFEWLGDSVLSKLYDYLQEQQAPELLDVLSMAEEGLLLDDIQKTTDRAHQLDALYAADLIRTGGTRRSVHLRLRRPFVWAWRRHRRTGSSVDERVASRFFDEVEEALGPYWTGPEPAERARLHPYRAMLDTGIREKWGTPRQQQMMLLVRASLVSVGARLDDSHVEGLKRMERARAKRTREAASYARAYAAWFEGKVGDAVELLERLEGSKERRDARFWSARMLRATIIAEQGDARTAQGLIGECPSMPRIPSQELRRLGYTARIQELGGDSLAAEATLVEARRLALREGEVWYTLRMDIDRARRHMIRDPARREAALRLLSRSVRELANMDAYNGYLFRGILAGLYLELGGAHLAALEFRRLPSLQHAPTRFVLLFAAYRAAALAELKQGERAAAALREFELSLSKVDEPLIERLGELARYIVEGCHGPVPEELGNSDERPLRAVIARIRSQTPRSTRVRPDAKGFVASLGVAIDLSNRPVMQRMVRHLVRSQGEVVPRAELFAATWPEDLETDPEVAGRRVRTMICHLRKMGLSAIQTAPGGYLLPEGCVGS